jgi:hypothetical protein
METFTMGDPDLDASDAASEVSSKPQELDIESQQQ